MNINNILKSEYKVISRIKCPLTGVEDVNVEVKADRAEWIAKYKASEFNIMMILKSLEKSVPKNILKNLASEIEQYGSDCYDSNVEID